MISKRSKICLVKATFATVGIVVALLCGLSAAQSSLVALVGLGAVDDYLTGELSTYEQMFSMPILAVIAIVQHFDIMSLVSAVVVAIMYLIITYKNDSIGMADIFLAVSLILAFNTVSFLLITTISMVFYLIKLLLVKYNKYRGYSFATQFDYVYLALLVYLPFYTSVSKYVDEFYQITKVLVCTMY